MTKVEEFWFEYLEKNKLPKNTPYSGEFVLGEDEINQGFYSVKNKCCLQEG